MAESHNVSTLLGEALLEALRQAVREEIRGLKDQFNGQERLLDAEEAAKMLSVSADWLYRHARKLPFSRKLGLKMLRFSSQGIQKYLATRKIS